jgi:hypothetical protein
MPGDISDKKICLEECPTGFIEVSDKCTREEKLCYQFNYFESSIIEQQVLDVKMVGGIVDGFDAGDPIAVYGRGLYFDGADDYFTLTNIDLGPEFSLAFWFKADLFDSLFTVYNTQDQPIYQVYRKTVGGVDTIAWDVVTAKG